MNNEFPLHSPMESDWCVFKATFILGPFILQEITAHGPVACFVTDRQYHCMLQTFVIPQRIFTSAMFIQDGAPSEINESVRALLFQLFNDKRDDRQTFY